MTLDSQQRTYIRGLAMQREVDLHIGRQGITPAVLTELNRVLNTHEIAKLKFGEKDRAARQALLASLCEHTNAHLCGEIGRTASLYRRSDTLQHHLL